jgi:APA family basic amino acid/polyamine antiporter
VGNPLFRTKSIERILADSDAPEHRLKRTLTAWDLTGLGIGAIIGTGIFVLIGTAIVGDAHRPGAGPGIMLSFILSGITCALAALCYAEFAAMIPVAGSAYTYSYATLGEFLAWLTGWNLILEYGVACVAVAIGWSGYFNNILKLCGLELPYWATHPPGADGGIANIPAAIIVLLVTCILIVGVKESARATCGIVLIKLAVIAFFIAVGTSSVDTANWSPFMPFGFAGVGAAAAIVFFAYIGFDAVSTTAEEAKNPQRDLPIGIFASLAICTVLYISVAAVLTGLVPYSQIDVHAPGGGRASHGRIQVGSRHRGNRCGSGHYQRPGGDDVGPDSGLFRHVARRSPRSLALRRPSEVSNAAPRDLFDRRGRRHHGRTHSDR